jgi:hypothetical protein
MFQSWPDFTSASSRSDTSVSAVVHVDEVISSTHQTR